MRGEEEGRGVVVREAIQWEGLAHLIHPDGPLLCLGVLQQISSKGLADWNWEVRKELCQLQLFTVYCEKTSHRSGYVTDLIRLICL